MTKQSSKRGQPITSAAFDNQPWETPQFPIGIKGLNLTADKESLEPGEYQILTNGYHRQDHALTSRAGLGAAPLITSGGTDAHTAKRLEDPLHSTFTRLLGIDTSLYLQASGAVGGAVDSGYSGDPLCVLPSHPTKGSGTWAIVADRNRMRQVRVDGLAVPLGLPAPTVLPTMVVQTLDKAPAVTFTTSDASGNATWAEVAGADFSAPPIPTDTPLANDAGGIGVEFVTAPGSAVEDAAKGYWSYWAHGFGAGKDMSVLASSTKVVDEDFFHIAVKLSHPQLTGEVRLYFVCSATFDPTFVPGVDGDHNTDFFVHTFPQSDYAAYLQSKASLASANQAAINAAAAKIALDNLGTGRGDVRRNIQIQRDVAAGKAPLPEGVKVGDPAPEVPLMSPAAGGLQLPSGSTWVEYGIVGRPLRRSNFTRFGETDGRDWSTITGVIVYMQAVEGTGGPIAVSLSDSYFYGGVGIDSADVGDQPYDWRYTHQHLDTGDEGNPSPEMTDTLTFVDTARTKVVVTPTAYGNARVRQNFYRRGGTLVDDWYFEGQNDSDGGTFSSEDSDDGLSAAGTVQLDHYEAVPSVDALGETIEAQACGQVFGPYNGVVFALRDPNRPGYVMWCLPDAPGHWPATNAAEVCPAGEELMAGCVHAGQPYVFSRTRGHVLYPSFGQDVTVTAAPTSCKRGLWSTTGLLVTTHGVVGVATDGIFLTAGGGPEKLLSEKIETIFLGKTVGEYLPIDKAVPEAIRLAELADELWFQYQDTNGDRQVMVYNWIGEYWRHLKWASGGGSALVVDEGNPENALLVGGQAGGDVWLMDGSGVSDNGEEIVVRAQTRADDYGRPRENKLLGDQVVEIDRQGVEVTIQNYLNGDAVVNPAQTLAEGTDRVWAVADAFGTGPQLARTVSTLVSWTSAFLRPVLYKLGVSIQPQPELTINRVTQWDDQGHPDEKYETGVTIDCDTGGVARTIVIERDLLGVVSTVATLSVNHDGRHKVAYSWAGVNAQMMRVRPTGDCVGWLLYRLDWVFDPEPPRLATWDTNFDAAGDQYYTGVDIYCNTYGVAKTVEFYVDNVLIDTQSVTATGRTLVHITLPWGRGHVFRFVSTDANLGTLYSYEWKLQAEPSEQHNFNENFTIAGSLTDKFVKGLLLEIDTYGVDKSAYIDVDDDLAAITLPTINTVGRQVVHLSFPQQRGRVFRLFSGDSVPCRKYSSQWIFDTEPVGLSRWETQEIDHDFGVFQTLLGAHITLRSSGTVTLTVTIYVNQTGDTVTQTYSIPSTAGAKWKQYVQFTAAKGVLFKYVLTAAAPFWLYREESTVQVQVWGEPQPREVHVFGNDDLDRTRSMTVAALAAARSGGGS